MTDFQWSIFSLVRWKRALNKISKRDYPDETVNVNKWEKDEFKKKSPVTLIKMKLVIMIKIL